MKQHLYKWATCKHKTTGEDIEKVITICGADSTHEDWAQPIFDRKKFVTYYQRLPFSSCKTCYKKALRGNHENT